MKSMYRIIGLLIGTAVILSSCVKHGNVYQSVEPERTTDLVVPEGFDWSSSRDVSLAVTSPVATVASFFLDEKCAPESQLATFFVPEGKTTFTLDIPDVNTALYIQYPLEKGGIKTLKQVIDQPQAKSEGGSAADVMFREQPLLTSDESSSIIYIPGGGGMEL